MKDVQEEYKDFYQQNQQISQEVRDKRPVDDS